MHIGKGKFRETQRKKKAVIVQKLKEAFAIGCSVTEACFYAGIVKQTFYNLFKNDNDLLDEFEALRESPNILARKAWIQGFAIDPKLARDYVVRKRSAEFGGRNRKVASEFDPFRNEDNEDDSKEVIATLEKLGILFPEEKPKFKTHAKERPVTKKTNK